MSLTILKKNNKIILTFSLDEKVIVVTQTNFSITYHFTPTIISSPHHPIFSRCSFFWRCSKIVRRNSLRACETLISIKICLRSLLNELSLSALYLSKLQKWLQLKYFQLLYFKMIKIFPSTI